MKSVTHNHCNYTEFWAWFPTRTTQGQLIWMTRYYIRPGPNGLGLVLSHRDMLLDSLTKS